MTRSEAINELAAALAKAQSQMSNAKKDSENPHFRSRYADLASVREACMAPFTANGLAVLQSPRLTHSGEAWIAELETTLMHTSGQFISDVVAVPMSKADAQGFGSAITYLRRYSLAAFAGIAPEDDDGNAAASAGPAKVPVNVPAGFTDWLEDLRAVADNGTDALTAAWKKSPPYYREHLTATAPEKVKQLKAIANEAAAKAVTA